MRIVLCDEDAFMREVIESLVASTGHSVAGIADTTADAVGLIHAARPDAVILDLALGFNSDFDIIESANDVGALAIVFSNHGDIGLLSRYEVRPEFVAKPDLAALEQALVRLGRDAQGDTVVEQDRRQRPSRAAEGVTPTSVSDAQAFFEAVNAAQPGDAMVSIDVPGPPEAAAEDLARRLRTTDRLLAFPHSVRFYLPAGGEEGIASLLERVEATGVLAPGDHATSVIVGDGEHGADAFDRLKHLGGS